MGNLFSSQQGSRNQGAAPKKQDSKNLGKALVKQGFLKDKKDFKEREVSIPTVKEQKQEKPPINNVGSFRLNCFSSDVSFPIPPSVVRSTTAEKVRKENKSDERAKKQEIKFRELRKASSDNRVTWTEALKSYNHVNSPAVIAPGQVILDATKRLKEASTERMKDLSKMAEECGIWNCGEFADFAFMIVNDPGTLKEGYTAHITSLNDMQIPEEGSEYYEQFQLILSEQEIPEDENHDHVFVVIKDKNQKSVFVIDLWQSLVANKPFVGTFDDFFVFLNKNVDGQYVRKAVGQKDFDFQ